MTLYYQLITKWDYWWQKLLKKHSQLTFQLYVYFKFRPLDKNADIFGRDLGANVFRNGPWNLIIPPSKHTSRRMVMELGYMTILVDSGVNTCIGKCKITIVYVATMYYILYMSNSYFYDDRVYFLNSDYSGVQIFYFISVRVKWFTGCSSNIIRTNTNCFIQCYCYCRS